MDSSGGRLTLLFRWACSLQIFEHFSYMYAIRLIRLLWLQIFTIGEPFPSQVLWFFNLQQYSAFFKQITSNDRLRPVFSSSSSLVLLLDWLLLVFPLLLGPLVFFLFFVSMFAFHVKENIRKGRVGFVFLFFSMFFSMRFSIAIPNCRINILRCNAST